MNRFLSAFAFITLSALSPLALAEDGHAAEVEQRLEEARARLGLSDEQLDRIAPLLKDSMAAQRRILASYGIDPQSGRSSAGRLGLRQARAMQEELGGVRADTVEAVSDILSPAQLEEFKRMQEERQAEMRQRIREGRS